MTSTLLDRAIASGLRHFVAIAGALAIVAYAGLYAQTRAPLPIRSDGYSYYVYLPSWLIGGDLSLEWPARDCCGGTYPEFTALRRWPETGRWVNPHPIGTAIMMAPFFVTAHLLTKWSNLPPDGFSAYYQHAAGLAGVFYLITGLAVLRRLLVRHFPPGPSLATLATVTWGTNLFHYGVYDSTFSHVYSFFAIALLIALTERWWTKPTIRTSMALGATAALIVLTRHTNIVFLVMVPSYGLTAWADVRPRVVELWSRRNQLAIVTGVAALGVLPQLAIYKVATGSWLVGPYRGLDIGFTWLSPHLAGVLFSTQKGLFFWSPALMLAVAGMVVASFSRGWARSLLTPAIVILVAETYVIASWADWQFGGSFGHRAFTDGLGLLAVFLATFFTWTARRPRLAVAVAAGTTAAVALSVAQMLQYWMGILPTANITWDQYRALFLRF